MIPYGKQDITQSDVQSVIDVLMSDFLTQGPKVPEFESVLKEYCDSKYAICVNSATSGLHIACKALQVGLGDSVWTSAITFPASSNSALYCGASVDFVDIDPNYLTMSHEHLERKLKISKEQGNLPKVVIPVHFAGHSCDMFRIYQLSKEYGFSIIEDASHAIGAYYGDKKIGCCEYSDITVFSFHPVKIITTAEGGAAVTNNKLLATRMALLRSHGITRDRDFLHDKAREDWYYEQIDLGFNYRMNDLQAALGCSQIKRLDEFVNKRRYLASVYNNLIKNLPVTTQLQCQFSSYHLYVIQLTNKNFDSRDKIYRKMREYGIGVNVHYIPVYHHPYYKKFCYNRDHYPHSEAYYKNCLTLPLHPNLSENDVSYIVDKLKISIDE